MAWLSRNDFQPSEMLHSDDLNNLANDIRDWGGDVNGGGHRLVNVILDTVGSGVVSSVFGRSGDVNAAPGDYTAAQVTNAVDKTQSYANPAWIASIPWAKITGAPAPPVSTVFGRSGAVVAMGGDYTAAQITNAVDVTQSYTNPPWLASLAYGKLTGAPTIVNSLNSLTGAVVLAAGANITLTPSGNSITIAASGGTSGMTDPTTTKGDLIVHGAGGTTRIGVGSDGQVLAADSTQALGVKWATPASGGSQTPWTSNIDAAGFELHNAGKIGIGTATPLSALHIVGDIAAYCAYQTNSDNLIGASLYLGDAPFVNPPFDKYAPGLSAVFNTAGGVASDLAFYCYSNATSRLEAMRILAPSGYVGILTPTPDSPLHVNGKFHTNTLLSDGAIDVTGGNVSIVSGSFVCTNWSYGFWIGDPNNTGMYMPANTGGLRFMTNDADQVSILPNGYVGINNMNPTWRLSLGTEIANMKFALFDSGSGNSYGFGIQSGGITVCLQDGTTPKMVFQTPGYFGIGTTAPSAPLSIIPPANITSAANAKQVWMGEGSNNAGFGMSLGFWVDGNGWWRSAIQNWAGGVAQHILDLQPGGGIVLIGFGASTPTGFTFNVNGSVNCTGYYLNGAPLSGGGVSAQNDVTASRALATPYHNTTGKPMFVAVTYNFPQGGSITAYTDGAATPGTVVSTQGNASVQGGTYSVYFWVLPNNYYQVQLSGGQLGNLAKWTEWY